MLKNTFKDNENVKVNSREVEKLKLFFPQYFDQKGNFRIEQFKEMLKEDEVDLNKEGYGLDFLGKSFAKYEASLETETVITPDTRHNELKKNKNSENIFIVGDNIDALKHLLKSYANKIKCIYIDPPYNTGSDGFVYPDNLKFTADELMVKLGIEEKEAQRIFDLNGKSTHSAWLAFMYPRLLLARDLLKDDGMIFISIDDNEQANLKLMCDEIFGEENFLANLIWDLGTGTTAGHFTRGHEYIMTYAKSKEFLPNFKINNPTEKIRHGALKKISSKNPAVEIEFPAGFEFEGDSAVFSGVIGESEKEYILSDKMEFKNGKLVNPVVIKAGFAMRNQIESYIRGEKVYDTKGQKVLKFYFNTNGILYYEKEKSIINPRTVLSKQGNTKNGSSEVNNLLGNDIFSFPKPTSLLTFIIQLICTESNDIVLDFFSGSATTAESVMQLNAQGQIDSKYIMVQIPEKIAENQQAFKEGYLSIDEIGRERIVRAAEKIKEESNANIDYGFKLYRLNSPTQATINDIIDFDPKDYRLFDTDFIKPFAFDGEAGEVTILKTWLNKDGYGLLVEAEPYQLETYMANRHENSLYIIKPGLESKDVMELIKRLETNKLQINRVVIYAYSLGFDIIHELKTNLANLKNNQSVSLIERY